MTIDSTRNQSAGPMPRPTTRVRVSTGDELDVWVTGTGEPVVFIHGAVTRDLLKPTMDELARSGRHQVIHYGRRGHGGRGLPAEPVDIPGSAPDVLAVLDALGIDTAHVAGHSFGAFIALEVAKQAPGRVRSVVLLEPVFGAHLQDPASLAQGQAMFQEVFPRITGAYMAGDRDGAVDMVWDATAGFEDSAGMIEPALPSGTRELAAEDAGTFLQVELPAMGAWAADPVSIGETPVPLTWIGSARSSSGFQESARLLQQWRPGATVVVIPDVGHYYPSLKPVETAAAIEDWLSSLR